MAEAFGVVAGALGLVTVLKDIKKGIDVLQQLRDNAGKVPSEIQSLTDDLEYLLIVLEELARRHGPEHPILKHCKKCCDDVAGRLVLLQEKIPRLQRSKLKQYKYALSGLKVDLGELQTSLTRAKANMSLAAAIPVLAVLETTIAPSPSPGSSRLIDDAQTVAIRSELPARRPLRNGCWVGSIRRCSCSCHTTYTNSLARGFFLLKYTQFQRQCDTEYCDSWTVGGSLKLKLTDFGLSWNILIQAQMTQRDGNTTLSPGLALQRVVPKNSPGFNIIRDFAWRKASLEEAKSTLTTIARSDPTFRTHVDQEGRSYIKYFLDYVCHSTSDASTLEMLLRFLLRDLKLTKDLYEEGFLGNLMSIQRHLDEYGRMDQPPFSILETITQEGFEIMEACWPTTGSLFPGFSWNRSIRDPLQLGFLLVVARNCPEFAGMTPLHDAVLIGSVESVQRWASKSDLSAKNFLGQTALHLSVTDPEKASVLIRAGSDLNALDGQGCMTPLEYTAILGCTQSAIIMIEAGADLPHTLDADEDIDLVYAAATFSNWQYLLEILPSIRAREGEAPAQAVADRIGFLFVTLQPYWQRISDAPTAPTFRKILAECKCANSIYSSGLGYVAFCQEGDSLMHHVRTATEAQDLLHAGFTHINHVNKKGMSPLMALASARAPTEYLGIAQVLVAEGADVNIQDNHQNTTLHHALSSQSAIDYVFGDLRAEKWGMLRYLLCTGAGHARKDSCACPCSPSGCSPTSAVHARTLIAKTGALSEPWKLWLPLATLDWILLVWEHRGEEAARDCLLADIRARKHRQLGMTHVCCWRSWNGQCYDEKLLLDEEDRLEILEEESEFPSILDREMMELEPLDMAHLEDVWFSLLRDEFDAYMNEVDDLRDTNTPFGLRKDGYTYENIVISAAGYKYGVNLEQRFGSRSMEGAEIWHGWLSNRIRGLAQLLRNLGIDLEDVSDKALSLCNAESYWLSEADAVPQDATEEERQTFFNRLRSWDEDLKGPEPAGLPGPAEDLKVGI